MQKQWPEGYQLAGAVGFKFPYFSSTPLSSVVPQASVIAINLIDVFLQWNPASRPTAQTALKHSYFQVGQQYSAALTNGLNQLTQQLNGAILQNQTNVNYQAIQQNGSYHTNNPSSIIATQIIPNQTLRTNFNMQPLIKPVQPIVRNQPIQPVAPIVYSFAQPDYTNKILTSNKKITWNKNESADFEDDELTNILG